MSQQALPQTSHYSGDDVKIIDKSSGYNGFFKVNVYRLQHRLFAGGWNEPIVRELFERGHAAALLQGSSLPITQVAEQCGFGTIRSFNRVFLKEKGMTPSAFRKQNVL